MGPHRRQLNEASIRGFAKCGNHCRAGFRSSPGPNPACVAAEYGFLRGSDGDIQRPAIQMYPGAHIAGRVGTTQHTCTVATGKRHTGANANPDANAIANTETITNADSRAHPDPNT